MKAVLISIQPKWCELIASGKKTVEVRKTRPKLETPFKVYIYCTKDEPLYHSGEKFWCKTAGEFGNGKVIGEFTCRNINEYSPIQGHSGAIYWLDDNDFERTGFEYLDDMCEYGNGATLYGWEISDLVSYDQPKGIWEFCHPCDRDPQCDCNYCKRHGGSKPILRAPQSWCYVEEVPR